MTFSEIISVAFYLSVYASVPIAGLVISEKLFHLCTQISVFAGQGLDFPLIEVAAFGNIQLGKQFLQGKHCSQGINQPGLFCVCQLSWVDALVFFYDFGCLFKDGALHLEMIYLLLQ